MAPNRVRVTIATGGRFHVLDLARELDRLGHDVTFHSYVPARRAAMFGLPRRCQVGHLAGMFPLLIWQKVLPKLWPELLERLMCLMLNRLVMATLKPCDVFVGMSGLYLEAALEARRRYGARIILERGSQHILAQNEILAAAGAGGASAFTVERELAGYGLADCISVPSRRVAESFARDHAAQAKLAVNPYGVDLDMFPVRDRVPDGPPTVLFVGGWSFQKGVDVLVDAVGRLDGVRLLHVGGQGDAPFPDDPWFEHVDSVSQEKLRDFYARAHVFALASRQDGYGVVLNQALASGLPVVGTDNSGAVDLASLPELAGRVQVVKAGDATALANALKAALDNPPAPVTEAQRQVLSWKAYGERYAATIVRLLGAT